MNILIVVDMQNDFVSGALGTPEARRIVPAAAERVAAGIRRGERIFFTRDTHGAVSYTHLLSVVDLGDGVLGGEPQVLPLIDGVLEAARCV